MNQTFLIDENTKEHIQIHLRPSEPGTQAYTITYMIPDRGIGLEVKINKELGYSKIIFKGNFTLPDYNPFARDVFGNIAQNKKLDYTDISQIRTELEKLMYNQ